MIIKIEFGIFKIKLVINVKVGVALNTNNIKKKFSQKEGAFY